MSDDCLGYSTFRYKESLSSLSSYEQVRLKMEKEKGGLAPAMHKIRDSNAYMKVILNEKATAYTEDSPQR
jgi:hypothetical protein